MTQTTLCVALALATLTLAGPAAAQRPTGQSRAPSPNAPVPAPTSPTKGFVLGVMSVAAAGVSVTGDDIDGEFKTNAGAGAGVMIGYGFNRRFTAVASLDIAKQRSAARTYDATFGLGHFELGLRANLPLGASSTLPYVSATVGSRAIGAHVIDTELERDYDMSINGLAFGVGAGFEHFFSPSVALDAGIGANFGRFNRYDADGEKATADVNPSRSLRLRVGMNWRPRARRST